MSKIGSERGETQIASSDEVAGNGQRTARNGTASFGAARALRLPGAGGRKNFRLNKVYGFWDERSTVSASAM